jgi:transmembrane sensor
VGNIVEFGAHTSIERQAREWLIRMDGDEPLGTGEKESLREWMNRSPAHREELIRIARFWSQANVLTELALSLEPLAQERSARRMRRVAPVALAATALLASVTLFWWGLQRLQGSDNGLYATAIGQQKTISLSDGSSIQLNTDSLVQVMYGDGSRGIRLLRGEALFSVMPSPNRPFEVYAADSVVRAVGTAFAVHLEGSKVDVTVTKGSVDVAEADSVQAEARQAPTEPALATHNRTRVKASETTRLSAGTDHIEVHHLAEPELQRRMAWQEGYLAFSGEPLSEVVEQVNRYSTVQLEVEDPKVASIGIGGRFRIGDLDGVLDVLHTNFGVQALQVNEHRIRLEAETSR